MNLKMYVLQWPESIGADLGEWFLNMNDVKIVWQYYMSIPSCMFKDIGIKNWVVLGGCFE